MIQLEGLSPLQQELAERIWQMDSMDEIVAWVNAMPRSVALQAGVVIQMMIAAGIDQQAESDLSQANAVLTKIQDTISKR